MATDFITAFGRLLRDGTLRDRLAANPEAAAQSADLSTRDWPAWRQLVPADVEFQAGVLLRKRLEQVRPFLPETCQRLGDNLWPAFHAYARYHWPAEPNPKLDDAFQFCTRLTQKFPTLVCATERNRLKFACSRRKIALYRATIKTIRQQLRPGLQLFIRSRKNGWREISFYLGG